MSFADEYHPPAIISGVANHDELPERGSAVQIKGKNPHEKARLLVGWRHQDDTPGARLQGRIWCWVGGNKFQVYDETYNRSDYAGVVRFCGPANFTMVRMFHPWFAVGGYSVPRDQDSEDKEWCRRRYYEAMAIYEEQDSAADINSAFDEDEDDVNRPTQIDSPPCANHPKGASNKAHESHIRRPYTGTDDGNNDSDAAIGGREDGEDDQDDVPLREGSASHASTASSSDLEPTQSGQDQHLIQTGIDPKHHRNIDHLRMEPESESETKAVDGQTYDFQIDDDVLTVAAAVQKYHDPNAQAARAWPGAKAMSRTATPFRDANSELLFIADPDSVYNRSALTRSLAPDGMKSE